MAHDTFTQDGYLFYETSFTALNNSGVSGRAILLENQHDKTVTVQIMAEGLEPDMVHPQHIHGFEDGTDSKTPTIDQDGDKDGFVELAEGRDTYGPIQLNLTTASDDASEFTGMGAMFPTADADGTLYYRETFDFGDPGAGALDVYDAIRMLEAKEIVLHGLELPAGYGEGTDGEVDGSGGYIAVLPVASGELMPVAPAADVLEAAQMLGVPLDDVVDWNAVAAQVQANFETTGQYFL